MYKREQQKYNEATTKKIHKRNLDNIGTATQSAMERTTMETAIQRTVKRTQRHNRTLTQSI